jgi:hypothetical protein
MAAVSDESGESSQQDISRTEKYSGKLRTTILLLAARVIRETQTGEYRGQKGVK